MRVCFNSNSGCLWKSKHVFASYYDVMIDSICKSSELGHLAAFLNYLQLNTFFNRSIKNSILCMFCFKVIFTENNKHKGIILKKRISTTNVSGGCHREDANRKVPNKLLSFYASYLNLSNFSLRMVSIQQEMSSLVVLMYMHSLYFQSYTVKSLKILNLLSWKTT